MNTKFQWNRGDKMRSVYLRVGGLGGMKLEEGEEYKYEYKGMKSKEDGEQRDNFIFGIMEKSVEMGGYNTHFGIGGMCVYRGENTMIVRNKKRKREKGKLCD